MFLYYSLLGGQGKLQDADQGATEVSGDTSEILNQEHDKDLTELSQELTSENVDEMALPKPTKLVNQSFFSSFFDR